MNHEQKESAHYTHNKPAHTDTNKDIPETKEAETLVPTPPQQFVITTPIAVLIGAVIIAVALFANGILKQNGQKKETLASQAGVRFEGKFQKCVQERTYKEVVQAQSEAGAKMFANLPPEQQGTPFTLILTKDKTFAVIGYRPLDAMTEAIDKIKKNDFNLAPLGIQEVNFPVPPVEKTDHILGTTNAPITLIEYSDLECPYCARFHPVLTELVKKYPNDLLWVYRHFPLDSIHPHARAKAEAAECAFAQGGETVFWNYVEKLFELKVPKDEFDILSL